MKIQAKRELIMRSSKHVSCKKMSQHSPFMVQRLLEGLMTYRGELGEVGLQLELLLRCSKVYPADHPYLRHLH